MSLSTEINMWNKIKYLIEVYRDLRKSTSPLLNAGTKIFLACLLALTSGWLIKIPLPDNKYIQNIEAAYQAVQTPVLILSMLGMILGAAMISWDIYQASKSARKIARVIVTGLPGMDGVFPNHILSTSEKRNSREPIFFGLNNPIKENLKDHITRFNSEICVDVFNRFVLHQECESLYIGGLTRIPLLVAYGSILRHVGVRLNYFDKFHRGGNWKLLNDENQNITLQYDDFITTPNHHGDIGLAVGFSTKILKDQLPPQVKDFTTIISPDSYSEERNLVKNQQNLQSISEGIKVLIDRLSTTQAKRIHLFLSVQSSLAIEIGRNYQEGTHRDWVIHNFDAQSNKYLWAILLSKDGIEEFKFEH